MRKDYPICVADCACVDPEPILGSEPRQARTRALLMSRQNFAGSEYGLDRLAGGIRIFSKSIRMLLSRNELTHEELVALSKWCNPWGETWLSTSQVSYLRTGSLKKAGPQTIDALGQINLRLAEAADDTSPIVKALPSFGKLPFKLPQDIFYLRHPESHEPLDAGGLYLVWIGRLIPEGLDHDGHISDMEARRLSHNISRVVQGWARDNRLTLSAAMDHILTAYGAPEENRRKMLRCVVAGLEVYSGDELTDELPSIGKVLSALDGNVEILPGDVRERLYKLPRD